MQLNQDVYIEILKYLPLQDKLNSALVCKEFYTLQKYIYKKHIITPTQNNLNSILFKKWDQKVNCFLEINTPFDKVPIDMEPYIYKIIISYNDLYSNTFINWVKK